MFRVRQSGFTIVELLVVIVVISILIALLLPNLFTASARGRDTHRKNDLKNIKAALETYYADHEDYPTSSEGLNSLVPEYIQEVPTDPKGSSYTYTSDGQSYTIKARLENTKDPVADFNGDYAIVSVGQ